MEKELEEQRKQKLKKRICEHEERNQQILSKAQSIQDDLGIEGELSNIVHTAIRKVEEDIVIQFEHAGLNFYSDSIVAEAISEQIISRVNRGHQTLVNYNSVITKAEESSTQIVALKSPSIFNKILEKIRRRFIVPKKTINPEALKRARVYLDEYMKANEELGEYNLRENIITALTQIICPVDNIMYLYQSIPPIMKNDIIPTLAKLGLGDLIPRLDQEITTRYAKESQRASYNLPERGMPELDRTENQERFWTRRRLKIKAFRLNLKAF